MVGQGTGPMSPLATLFMAVVIVTGLLLGLVRGRGQGVSDPDGWSGADDGHCSADDGGSCDAH